MPEPMTEQRARELLAECSLNELVDLLFAKAQAEGLNARLNLTRPRRKKAKGR